MAVRVENTEAINHGTLANETTVTHGRVSVGGEVLITRPLNEPITVVAGGQFQFNPGDIDMVFPKNQFEDPGYNALLALAFDGVHEVRVDGLTDANTVVVTNGYSHRNVSALSLSTEAD